MNQLNAAMRNVFHDLVERRLWPVALVLVLALIAIPILLSHPASTGPGAPPVAPATAPATGAGGSLSAFQPVVNTEGSKSSEIRKSLRGFATKDPFKVQGLPKAGATSGQLTAAPGAAAATGTTTPTGTTTGTTTGTGTTAGTGTSGSGQSTSGSSDSTGSNPTLTYFTYTVDVRFGKADNLDKKTLERFRALPSSKNPVVVFMGVKTDGKTAVFLVSSATGTTGEGDCEPADTCTFLYMKKDQQQSFEAVDENNQVVTYVLKLLKVNVKETEAPKSGSSSSSSKASSRAERRAERRAARRAERTRQARERGFAARVEAIGF
jgi:hypothetical protein